MTQALPAPAMMVRVEARDAVRVVVREGVPMGTEAQFAALYQARFTDLATQLYAYLGDATEAQDVVQEAFVRAWQRWDRISEYDDPVAWIRRVAWNLATSRHRRTAVVRRFLARSGPPDVQPGATPDRVALVAALRRLPERQRHAMVLHYLGDLSVADIAQDLGVAAGTVKSWLHRGRAELARLLSDSPDQGTPPRLNLVPGPEPGDNGHDTGPAAPDLTAEPAGAHDPPLAETAGAAASVCPDGTRTDASAGGSAGQDTPAWGTPGLSSPGTQGEGGGR